MSPSTPTTTSLNALGIDERYSPAVIDRFARLVDRMPVPAWGFFLLLLLLGYAAFAAGRWISGYDRVGTFWLPAPAVIWDVSILALHQYLDRFARRALRRFNTVLGASDAELQRLADRLTVLPARLEIVGVLVWTVLAAALALVQIGSFLEYFPAWEIVLSIVSFAIGGAFFVHVFYQLQLVSRIYASAADVDLFDPGPLYSFSGLTVRTAIGIVLIQYLVLLAMPAELRTSTILVPVAAITLLSVVVFVWPLLGVHRRLVAQKELVEGDINRLLKKSVEELTRSAGTGEIEDAETLDKTLSALRTAQATVAELPTWPWQPSTVRVLATALLLPIVLWILQELFVRLTGLLG